MSHICKIVTLFALLLQLALSVQARLEPAPVEETAENDDASYYAPSPYGGDDKFPESPYPLDDMMMASELEGNGQYPPTPSPSSAYPPGPTEQDYPYSGEYASPSPSPSPSPAPYIQVMAPEVDDFYGDDYSPSEAPSLKDSGSSMMAAPPPAEWEYRAEDDAEYEDEEGYGEEENKRGMMGFVIGAVCLVGLGGLVYKRRKANQKRKHPAYLELSRTGDA